LQIKPETQFTVEQCIQEKNKISQRQREVSVDADTSHPLQKEKRDCERKNKKTKRKAMFKRVMNNTTIKLT